MKMFVPGRICLFGEHSDWAGGYRRINAGVEKGYTIIAGTSQGIHAEAEPHPSRLILTVSLNDGSKKGPFEIEMDRQLLLEEAQKGGFFSYACGVAYQILTHYHVQGLRIDNYLTDLPIKKGLSSSAAICVLVSRAFNRVYDLKMTVRGEMEYAYQGEITTPSRCGRMDQGCAYGDRPILMIFDGDRIDIKELRVSKDLFFVIVDLKAHKDTKEILAKLNRCYPFADNDVQKNVQQYLGPINRDIVHDAVKAVERGDAVELGELMKKAQREFDAHLGPACPSQLTAPILHRVLNYKPIQPFITGGKGVGSQGDGTAQFIVKDEECQQRVAEIIEHELEMPCLPLAIRSARKIRKAVIPAAGFGTRLFPASKAVKKELFPIVDRSGKAKPALLIVVEELIDSGIEEIAVIVQKRDLEVFESLFRLPPYIENYNKLSKEDQKYSDRLLDLGRRISFLTQETQEGFGHAVYCARDWIGDEPFLLTLGDYIYSSDTESSCTRQIMDIFEKYNTSMVGLKVISKEDLDIFGCVTGSWEVPESILSITEFYEKPSLEYAREHLQLDGMENDHYLALFGQYILKPEIFRFLGENIGHDARERGEFQLTSCLDKLRREDGFTGFVVKGKSFDIGMPDKYREALIGYYNGR